MTTSAEHPHRSYKAASVVAIAIVLASMVTWRTSYALFTANTTNGPQSFSTGSVVLTDNDAGGILFNVTNLKPSASAAQCIKISYSGTLAAAIKVYGTGLSATNSLDQYVTLKIEEGSSSATVYPSCTNFVASSTIFNAPLNTFGTNFGTATGSWAPSAAADKDYRLTYTIDPAIPNGAQSSTAGVTITWEAQNT